MAEAPEPTPRQGVSGTVQIGGLPLGKRAVHLLVDPMHDEHKRNAYGYVLKSCA